VLRHAAAISYYTVFSLPATLMIVLTIASRVLGETVVKNEFFDTTRLYLDDRTTRLLEDALQQIHTSNQTSGWIAFIGTIVLIIVAGGIIRELRIALNSILGNANTKQTFGMWLGNYITSLLLLIVTGIILIASITSGTVLSLIHTELTHMMGISLNALSLIHSSVTYVTITILFFLLYLFLPARRYPPLIVLLCSVIASAILVIGTVIASFYIAQVDPGQAYGIAANVLILLFWLYFSANAFLFGAELIDTVSRTEGVSPRKRRSVIKGILKHF